MTFYQVAFLFFTYSFLGWVGEVVFTAAVRRKYQDRGVLSGPLCILYGIGALVITFALRDIRDGWFFLFVFSAVYATVIEWIGGHILEYTSHTRWWDYSMYRFNLGGFICPQFSLLWGLGSVLLMVVVHPLLSKPSAAIPTLVLIWLDVIFGGLFLADLIVSAIQAVGFSKQLARIDELRKAMRTTSDALTEVIGTSAMTMDTLLDEQKLQLALAKLEGRENAAELRAEVTARVSDLRDKLTAAEHDHIGARRLLRAFPGMKSLNYAEALTATRAAMVRLRELAANAKETAATAAANAKEKIKKA